MFDAASPRRTWGYSLWLLATEAKYADSVRQIDGVCLDCISLFMRSAALMIVLAVGAFALGCNNNPPTPAEIRHDTADATATVAGDVKGAALGVRDGLEKARGGPAYNPVNINTAGRLQLMTLPGLTSAEARQIIAHRPYSSPNDLRLRRVIPDDEFDKIQPSIVTN
jgi:hypothetical protein